MIWFCDFCRFPDRQTHPPREFRVGIDHQTLEGVIGSEGVRKCNSNWLLHLRKLAEHELLITNTVFRLPTHRKTSWTHPRSKTLASYWQYHSTKIGQTGCQSDKGYVWCRLLDRSQACCQQTQPRIQPVRRPQGKKVPKKLDVPKLKQDSKRQASVNDLCSRLDALKHSSEDVDESWTFFRDTVHSSAMDYLGPRLVWWEWQRNPGTPWRETPKTQGLPQKYQLNICLFKHMQDSTD